jgi:hypothetical protein
VQEQWGYIEEYRPHWKPEYDLMQMKSPFFVCDVAPELIEGRMESYEITKGMKPVWISVDEAMNRNRLVTKRP